jgi:hypothetical protein
VSPTHAALSARVLTHAQHTLTILRDAFGPRLWYAETGFLACIKRVLPQARLALATPTPSESQWLAPSVAAVRRASQGLVCVFDADVAVTYTAQTTSAFVLHWWGSKTTVSARHTP